MTAPANGERPLVVLVIEDEPLVAMLIEDVLVDADHRPFWTPDGHAAPGSPPLAAVVGLRLHGNLDGRDVVRRLRREHPGLPVVVLTGFDGRAPEADLRGLGGPTARLHKPQDLADLPRRLAEVLAAVLARPAPPRRRQADNPPAAATA